MQQQQHALEIPEILSLVGSFLPLWEHTSPQYSENGTFVFNPNPLCTCLQVSKLWNRTLLPILWHGYWYESMIRVPDEIIRRHSHLFMTLHLSEWAHLSHDISLFNCTSLIDLSIFTCDDRRNKEGGVEGGGGLRGSKDSRKQRGVNILHAKRLLRSNPQLQGLSWRRFGGKGKALDVEDFVTLSGLERLTLENWNSSGGQLGDVLRIAAGSLQEIKLDCIDGVLPEQLSAPVTSTLTEEECGTVKGTGLVHGDGELVLAQLELLEVGEIGFSGGVDEFLAELVKRCPRLKTFRTFSLFKNFGVDHLATCLGNHCPNIESLELLGVLETYKVETLIRHCSPNQPQLRTLHIVIHNLTDGPGLVSVILQHATTLEDLWIRSTHPKQMDGSHCLELLVGCARLSRFAYLTEEALDLDFLEAMKQERWGCRGTLRELKFREGCKGFSTRQTNAERREVMSLLSKTGWEEVRDDIEDDGEHSSGNDDSQNDPTMLRKVLELVRCQQLEALKVLIVGLQTFQRI
ncbi:MAG: hypothetical protein J3R72DRAFT_431771 [Linnemannia gamsii]|nr:MAG: hypothetical protein J3R72DRAFT_431771 [Linnemannia gamsii]